MKHLLAVVFATALAATSAQAAPFAFQDGGGGMGGGGGGGMGGGGKGPPQTPGGKGPEGGESGKKDPKDPKPQKPTELQSAPIVLRGVLDASKTAEGLMSAVSKAAGVKDVTIVESDVHFFYTGDYQKLALVQNAATGAGFKATLIAPALFLVEFAPGKERQSKLAVDAMLKVGGIEKAYLDGSRVLAVGDVKHVDPREFATTLKDAGFKFVGLKSHRLRTLSFEAMEKGTRGEKLRERLLKVPGMLRADVDFAARTVTVLLIKDTAKDLDLVAAAEEVGFTLFPGKAEDEEPAPPEPKK